MKMKERERREKSLSSNLATLSLSHLSSIHAVPVPHRKTDERRSNEVARPFIL
jgi:hypothetical protein